ncbi:AraC family transcriptional regulator [Pseudomonas sp. MAFF 212408]|uniref:AraC family transcriptional regulator n=2 Tax=Pseudomonas kitaguniensis TaxID=2607908 RepID=A0A5N7KKV3_9PSED|nr:AraC family transcriptional regulator [Pseudomonas kitaguniensis]
MLSKCIGPECPVMPMLAASCAHVVLRLINCVPNPSLALTVFHAELMEKIQNQSMLAILTASTFIEAVAAEAGDVEVGLASYAMFHPGQLSSHFYAIMSSATLGEAMKTASHFSVLSSDRTPLVARDESGVISVNFLGIESLGVARHYIDCCMSTFMGLTHWLEPWDRPLPDSASFSYDEPRDLARLEAVFGKNLSFGCPINKITFASETAKKPLATANAALRIHHMSHASEELARRQVKLAPAVRNHIYIGLTLSKDVSLEIVARELNLGSRTLQNRLDDESTGFRELFDECRRQLAGELLRLQNSTVTAIAQRLKFRDSSSFHKACNRWFGCPPGSYRSRVLEES